MPGAHAPLSPSASKRWLSCPPSARLNAKLIERFGEKSSVFVEEGTKAHALAELKLRRDNGESNTFRYNELRKALGDIPAEMDRNTGRYEDEVMERFYAARQRTPDAQLCIEQRVDMSQWAKDCWGTSDAIIVSDEVLFVIDYKNGSGVPVSAIENPQARLYALGAVNAYGDLYGFNEVRTVIVQPKLESVTEERLTRDELLAWGESIRPAAEQAYRGEGEFKTGDHCRFCAARAICAARASEAMDIFKHGFDEPRVIPDSDIPGILSVLDTAEAWIKDIRAYAQSQAIRGQRWYGYKLVRGRRPGRKWTSEDEAVNILARAGYSPEQYEDTKLKSVSALEKEIGKTAFDALLGGLVEQGEGALTLVPETDSRPEYSSGEEALSDLLD